MNAVQDGAAIEAAMTASWADAAVLRDAAWACVARMQRSALWVEASALPSDPAELALLARLIDREAALHDALPVLAVHGHNEASAVALAGQSVSSALWLGAPADALRALPTPLRLSTLRWPATREAARGGLHTLALRIESRVRFEDLVLPAAQMVAVRDIARHLRLRERVHDDWGFGDGPSRGLGLTALFAGESGTGKTLAAEAIANEAGLDLYRIDLATLVSKYVGETEKNLKRLFDAAEHSGAVLLFDEADALFGKRSEVKGSHDRYANIEVAYLLQRLEAYHGLAILTTNMKSALDRAFLRRIRFVVTFPFPDAVAREQIWRRQFPARAPLGTIDFAALAQLHVAGGSIRSVALNAAFKAAAGNGRIEQSHLLDAARSEFAKLERSYTDPLAGARHA